MCACTFLGIKYVEYRHKWREGLLWASKYDPKEKQAPVAAPPGEAKATGRPAMPQSKTAGSEAIVPQHVGIFFSLYFAMTGLHAVHVLAGMAAIGWVLRRSVRGDFNSRYFGPVDYVGLYWHLVDMVWIYLFPLLYLIR